MVMLSFLLGLAIGLSAAFLGTSLQDWKIRLRNPVGDDEKYLLAVARAAGGRLIVKEDPGTPILALREVADPTRLVTRGQVDRLLNRSLLKRDASGLPGRYSLSPEGWAFVKHLPALPVEIRRAGNWFNSISGRRRR